MKSSSDDFDTDDEVPLSKMGKSSSGPSTSSPVTDKVATSATSKNSITVKSKRQYRWRHISQDQKNLLQNTTFIVDQNKKNVLECESALTYFKRFFDDETINLICEETNWHSAQCNVNKGATGTCKDEIEKYLGVLMMMSVIKAPHYQCYWETYTRYEPIA